MTKHIALLLFSLLALATAIHAAWMVSEECGQGIQWHYGHAYPRDCYWYDHRGIFLRYDCDGNIGKFYECTDSKCQSCELSFTYKLGVCNGETNYCFNDTIDYAQVVGTPHYVVSKYYWSSDCNEAQFDSESFYSVGACVVFNTNEGYESSATVSCSATNVTLIMHNDITCSTVTSKKVLPLNTCIPDGDFYRTISCA